MDKPMDDSTVATLCIFTLITTNCTVHYRRSAHCKTPSTKTIKSVSLHKLLASSTHRRRTHCYRQRRTSTRSHSIRLASHPPTKSDSCRPKPPPTTMSR